MESELRSRSREGASAPDPTERLERELLASPVALIRTECRLATDGMDAAAVARLARHAERLASLLARGDAPESVDLDPSAVLAAGLAEFEALAHERGVAIHRHLEKTPRVRVDAVALDQAVRHLVRAAVESAPAEHGDVTVALGELDGAVHFAVADDGPGLTAHEVAAVLEPSDDPSGYAVVAGLAQALRGRFVLESGLGSGTQATLVVPALVAAPAPASHRRAARPSRSETTAARRARRPGPIDVSG